MPKVPQHSPYKAPKKVYGAAAQDTIVPDDTAKLDGEQIKLMYVCVYVCMSYGLRMEVAQV